VRRDAGIARAEDRMHAIVALDGGAAAARLAFGGENLPDIKARVECRDEHRKYEANNCPNTDDH
jgi:hypothetical protein